MKGVLLDADQFPGVYKVKVGLKCFEDLVYKCKEVRANANSPRLYHFPPLGQRVEPVNEAKSTN